MAGFKSAVTSSVRFVIGNANINIWQRNYYERVIRNRKELRKIRRYIKNNPTEWLLDDDNKQ
jgi:REP element-mobilizing transposase RayT